MQPGQTTSHQLAAQESTPADQAPLHPIAQFDCWYIPEGKFTIFNYRRSLVMLYLGWMVIYRKSDHQELARIQLTPDLHMKYFFSFVRFAQLNGRKYSSFKLNNTFMTTPMWFYGIFFVGILVNLIGSAARVSTGVRDIGMQVSSLAIMLAAFGMLATGTPKAKELIATAKRAAGVVS